MTTTLTTWIKATNLLKAMNKIINRVDLWLHAAACYVIATFIGSLLHLCTVDTASVFGVVLALAAGVGYELYLLIKGKGADALHIVADIAGCLLAVIVMTFAGI